MELQEGSIVSMIPAEPGWQITCQRGKEVWRIPVVGWAILVVERTEHNGAVTDLDAVIATSGPQTLGDFKKSNQGVKCTLVFLNERQP